VTASGWPFEPEAWRLVVMARILLAIIAALFFLAYILGGQ